MNNTIEKGQIWAYKTRKGEEDSFIVIIDIDRTSNKKIIGHIAIEDLTIIGDNQNPDNMWSINHLPVDLDMLTNSLQTLKGYREIDSFPEGYFYWQDEYDKGKAGVWSIEITEIIELIQNLRNDK